VGLYEVHSHLVQNCTSCGDLERGVGFRRYRIYLACLISGEESREPNNIVTRRLNQEV